MLQKGFYQIDIGNGSTANVPVQADMDYVYVSGTATGNFAIGATGTVRNGHTIVFFYNGNSGGNTISVLGSNIPPAIDSSRALIFATRQSGAWVLNFVANAAQAVVANAQIAANAAISRSKLAAGTASRALVNDGAGALVESAVTAAELLVLSGVTASTAEINFLSGVTSAIQAQIDAKASSALALGGDMAGSSLPNPVIANGAVTASKLSPDVQASLGVNNLVFDVTIPSSEVLTGNSAPITLMSAQGAGKIIAPYTGDTIFIIEYNTTPYATNVSLDFFVGGTERVMFIDNALASTGSRKLRVLASGTVSGNTASQYVANSPLTVRVRNGNPTAGDSDIRIMGICRVIDL